MAIAETYWLEQINKNLARIADALEELNERRNGQKPEKSPFDKLEEYYKAFPPSSAFPPSDWVSAPPDYVGDWIPYRRDAKPSDVPLQSTSASSNSASNK